MQIAKQLKKEKLILVTDATALAGSTLGRFLFAGQRGYYHSGQGRTEQGALSGSALGGRPYVHYTGIAVEEALRMASLCPEQALGMAKQLGSIHPGKVANLVLFTDDLTVIATRLNGPYQPVEY